MAKPEVGLVEVATDVVRTTGRCPTTGAPLSVAPAPQRRNNHTPSMPTPTTSRTNGFGDPAHEIGV